MLAAPELQRICGAFFYRVLVRTRAVQKKANAAAAMAVAETNVEAGDATADEAATPKS